VPIIELPGQALTPGASTSFVPIFAVMLYPKDETQREHFLAACMARSYWLWREADAPEHFLSDFHAWIGVLWELPLSPKRVFQDGLGRVRRASLSGRLLLYLLRLARHHQRHCTVERAKMLVSEFDRPKGKPVSESLAEKAWAEFKTVSHLWVALLNLTAAKNLPEVIDNEQCRLLLGNAEAIRKLAEGFLLLLPDETWRAPEREEIPERKFINRPLEGEKLSFLDRYFPA
jgi:hypothetical protein